MRVAADILIEITTRKKTIFLSRSCVKIYFLDQIPTDKEILDSLRYFGYTLTKSDLDGWEFNIPFHRVDIFEEQDLIEDILLFQMDKFTTVKSIHSSQIECSNERMRRRMDALRDDLVSFGFREIKTPLLRKEGKSYLVRSSILPSILEYEKGIQHLPRPHQIFEIGSVIEADRLLNRLIFSRIEVETDFNTFFSIICHILKPISSIPVTLKPFESSKYASGKGFILEWNTLSIGEF